MEIGRLLRVGQGDIHRQDILCFITGMHPGEVVHRPNQQPRSHEQRQRQRDLDYRHAAKKAPFCSADAGSCAPETVCRVQSRSVKGGRKTSNYRGDNRRRETKR
jgi:hypothetical protein